MDSRRASNGNRTASWLAVVSMAAAILGGGATAEAQGCTPASPPAGCNPLATSSMDQDFAIRDCRTVKAGNYEFKLVHVLDGGILFFLDQGGTINFNASSILVEQGGAVKAGEFDKPFGCGGTTLNVGLYGPGPKDPKTNPLPPGPAIQCMSQNGNCYPGTAVGKGCFDPGNGSFKPTDPCQAALPADRSKTNSAFEEYQDLGEDRSLFGYKAFGVSYGGSVELFGRKGVADRDRVDPARAASACA